MSQEQVYLHSGKRRWLGWQNISITESIENLCSDFSLMMTGEYQNTGRPIAIDTQEILKIHYGTELVLTGYVDEMPYTYDSESHEVGVNGRSKTCDLVDCCYIGKKEWNNQTLGKICKDLCSGFDISVLTADGVGNIVIKKAFHEQSDTRFSTIQKICMSVGVLPISTYSGDLFLTRTGASVCTDDLELGVNVLGCSGALNNTDRFRTYRVISQAKSDTGAAGEEEKQTEITGDAVDPVINRPRTLVIPADRELSKAECRSHAQWEARTRAGRSRKKTYRVMGWRQRNGDLWPLNSLVNVKDPWAGTNNARMLITALERTQDKAAGTFTLITVMDPIAFQSDPTAKLEIPEVKDDVWQ